VTERLTLSVDEAARLVGCSDDTIRKNLAAGSIPHVRVGRVIKIHREGLERWLRAAAAAGAQIASAS
jgi:excisionase family DNA binding protein